MLLFESSKWHRYHTKVTYAVCEFMQFTKKGAKVMKLVEDSNHDKAVYLLLRQNQMDGSAILRPNIEGRHSLPM